MKLMQEFREFAVKGNVMDMGVGIVIGAAFTSIVNSLVKDVFTPVLALITTGVDFTNWFITLRAGDSGGPYASLVEAQLDNAITLNLGLFFNAVISFFIVTAALFFLVRAINRLRRPIEVTADPVETRECPFCFTVISMKASRCPNCTSQLQE